MIRIEVYDPHTGWRDVTGSQHFTIESSLEEVKLLLNGQAVRPPWRIFNGHVRAAQSPEQPS